MNFWGSAFITQIIYASFGAVEDNFSLTAEDGQALLTEDGSNIDVEN